MHDTSCAMYRAHPRAGGENLSARKCCSSAVGSSPRGRGKHSHAIPERLHPRLIPARAGKTGGVVRRIAALAAHPRAGGENSSHSSRSSAPPGSSPRGRGKRPSTKKDPRPYGLIPARAGKTHGLVTKASSKPAHPRAGGENGMQFAGRIACVRLIPARAGKTGDQSEYSRYWPAHPRAGGENARDTARTWIDRGSSPRGRGKPRQDRRSHQRRRLIPARAGKTRCHRDDIGRCEAHPRAGGENCWRWCRSCRRSGSSPRGRGKLADLPGSDDAFGLIPARAGKTRRACPATKSPMALPRAGGENRIVLPSSRRSRGSSPRGRGKRRTSS